MFHLAWAKLFWITINNSLSRLLDSINLYFVDKLYMLKKVYKSVKV